MATDLLIYADGKRQLHTAGSLIVFGAEQAKRAKLIQGLPFLKDCIIRMQNNGAYDRNRIVNEFIWEYVIDCVRMLMFFEGYMKAELIVRNFCVHLLNKDGKYIHMAGLVNQQKKRPIDLSEIEAVESFVIDKDNDLISHNGIKDTTLSINVLLGFEYCSYYQMDDILVNDIKFFNAVRNKLHFNASAEFQLSSAMVERVERVNNFIDLTLTRWIQKKA